MGSTDSCGPSTRSGRGTGGGDAVYGIGVIGAIVYFVQHADSFWGGVLGILEAIIWPAMVVYHLLGHLGV